jgi:cyclin-dependent kinase
VPTPAAALEDHHQDEHIFPNIPNTGATIGRYTHASHHSDGLFSEVFRAVDPDPRADGTNANATVALKITTPALMTPPHDAVREARILNTAKGSTIIPLLETFQQPGGRLVLVFPFMPHDLGTLLQRGYFSAQQTDPSLVLQARRTILRDLFAGLAHLHGLDILHRDIKPGNILLASPQGPAYLADFGIAWSAHDRASEPRDQKILDVGTTSYRAPELLFGCTTYGPGVDLWAAGCVAAQLVRDDGRQPLFDAGDLGSELALIKSIFTTLGTPDDGGQMWPETHVPGRLPDWGKFRFQQFSPKSWNKDILPGVPEPAVNLVRRLVMYESDSRLNASEVSTAVVRRFARYPFSPWVANYMTYLQDYVLSDVYAFVLTHSGSYRLFDIRTFKKYSHLKLYGLGSAVASL